MPTENRSSNTENLPCPFCAGRVDPEGWLRGDGTRGPECESCGATAPTLSVWNSANPTTQPHPDPIAWMVGTAFWWTKEEAERDAATTGMPIVGLGPMVATGPAEQQHREPVAWVRFRNGEPDYDGDAVMISNVRGDTLGDGDSWQPVYTQADPGEVELLRSTIEQQKNLIASLRAELVESRSIDASAEPSAPAMQIPEGYCVMPRRLTAENGAKALLLGEFKLEVTRECPECLELEEPAEGCEICDGAGEYGQRYTIPWDKIKFIYSEAVKGLALKQ